MLQYLYHGRRYDYAGQGFYIYRIVSYVKAKPAAFSEIENDVSSGTVRVMVSRLRKKLRVIVNKVLSIAKP